MDKANEACKTSDASHYPEFDTSANPDLFAQDSLDFFKASENLKRILSLFISEDEGFQDCQILYDNLSPFELNPAENCLIFPPPDVVETAIFTVDPSVPEEAREEAFQKAQQAYSKVWYSLREGVIDVNVSLTACGYNAGTYSRDFGEINICNIYSPQYDIDETMAHESSHHGDYKSGFATLVPNNIFFVNDFLDDFGLTPIEAVTTGRGLELIDYLSGHSVAEVIAGWGADYTTGGEFLRAKAAYFIETGQGYYGEQGIFDEKMYSWFKEKWYRGTEFPNSQPDSFY